MLSEKNCHVLIIGRERKKTEQAAKELGCDYKIADLTSPYCIDEICQLFFETGLDYLVNCAGIGDMIFIDNITTPVIEKHFNVNVFSPMHLIVNLSSALQARKGSITNVSSIITTRNIAGFSIYSATKGAIEAMTKSMAVELAPKNIRINAVCPGAIETPMMESSNIPTELIPQMKAQTSSIIPLQRWGTALEVATVIYAQLTNTYVTGSIWNVDGGVGA
ncbi:MAG: SDR family NAD(P)-dependent oxidoreductase [Exilibacterium sp.]